MQTVLTHVQIYGADGRVRRGHVTIDGDRIGDVVTNAADAGVEGPAPVAGDGTTVVDMKDAFLFPGFVDTHIHLTSLALKSMRCDLAPARSAGELYDLLRMYARTEDGPNVVGVDWDESRWDDRTFPTRKELDAIDERRPVMVRRICGHMGVVNSVLLSKISDHPGFVDAETGLLREHAIWEAGRFVDPEPECLAGGVENAIRDLHKLGITAIHDIVEPTRLEGYLEGVSSSSAPLRIDILLHVDPDDIGPYREMCEAHDATFLRLAGVKCFLDGSLGGRTAALSAPYRDEDTTGTLLIPANRAEHIARGTIELGLICAMHAIGDRAIDQALDVMKPFSGESPLFRIEHCEMVREDHFPLLEKAPVVLALQPNFVRNWAFRGGLYESRIGRERLHRCNPFRSFAAAGIDVIFGSDGMPPGPLYGLKGATEHPVVGERLTPVQAVDRYTRIPNLVGPHRRQAGIIEPGRLADLVVLSANPAEGVGEEAEVRAVYVGGKRVYSADGQAGAPGEAA